MFINRRRKEINLKIVYYGPALSGKTTSLQWIFRRTPAKYRSNLMSIKTKEDRTLFFDFLQVETGKIMGLTPKFKLYTVPGQTYYQASRRVILQGVDGVVFVADSSPKRLRANIESWHHLNQHLRSYHVDMTSFPVIVQANKRDLSDALSLPLLMKALNAKDYPLIESVATRGTGVTDALKLVIQTVLRTLTKTERQRTALTPRPPLPTPPASGHALGEGEKDPPRGRKIPPLPICTRGLGGEGCPFLITIL